MRALADAPFGKAAEVLRKHDPAWGLATEDNPVLKWSVMLSGTAAAYAVVEVEALDEASARKLALGTSVSISEWEIEKYEGIEDIEVFEISGVKAVVKS